MVAAMVVDAGYKLKGVSLYASPAGDEQPAEAAADFTRMRDGGGVGRWVV